MTYEVKILDYNWAVTLTNTNELIISFVKEVKGKATSDSFNWFNDDYVPARRIEWVAYDMEIPTDVSIFELKRKLLNAVIGIVKNSNREYFMFIPADEKRGKLFKLMADTIAQRLGDNWSYQILAKDITGSNENHYFYFTKF